MVEAKSHSEWPTRGISSQVNRIRQSLQVMAANSSTFGLRQPHLQRTRLCELPDSELDQGYVRQRGQLQDLVHRLAKPKVLLPAPTSVVSFACVLGMQRRGSIWKKLTGPRAPPCQAHGPNAHCLCLPPLWYLHAVGEDVL